MENETNEQKKEQPAGDTGAGVQLQTASIVEQASAERQKLEKLFDEIKAERERNEEILAKQILGGRTSAGSSVNQETADEKWAREAKIRYAGTGMCPV